MRPSNPCLLRQVAHLRWLLLAWLGLHANVLIAATGDGNWLLPGSQSTLVARDMSINGTPTTIYHFSIDQPPSVLRQRYRKKLAGPIVESESQGWQVIGSMNGKSFITVRMKPSLDGHTEGTLAIADIEAGMKKRETRSDFSMPHGSHRIIVTESKDLGVQGRVEVYTNTTSVAGNLEHIGAQLRATGYTGQPPRTVAHRDGPVSVMQLRSHQKDVLVKAARKGNQTSVVVNTLTREGS